MLTNFNQQRHANHSQVIDMYIHYICNYMTWQKYRHGNLRIFNNVLIALFFMSI